jgi:DNA polymerase-4
VIASASYEAREHGVRSAQPTATAVRLCPSLIVVPAAHGIYGDMSARVFSIFRDVTPFVEGLSLDEAFLDIRGLRLHYDSPMAVAEQIRSTLRVELGLPASVGIASVKFVAKLASEAAKPDGVRHVRAGDQSEFLASLPASSMWGVGPATQAALARLGVETVGDIASLPESSLIHAVGPSARRHLHDLANGIDPREVIPDSHAKSISVEETYERDLESIEVVETALLSLAQRLSGRLRRAGLRGRTISLKLRYEDFTTITRSHTAPSGVDGGRAIYAIAVALSSERERFDPVRLLGLGASSLLPAEAPAQMGLDADGDWDDVEDAVAEIRHKFGDSSVRPARLLTDRDSSRSDEDP